MPLDSLKTYVSWHVLRAAAPWLSQPFVDANFKMRQALTGQKEIQDRVEALRRIWSTRSWAKRWGSDTSRPTFGPRASSAC